MRLVRYASVTLLAASACLLAATAVHAQTFQGGLRGSIKDFQGVIPGATVTLLHETTGRSRDAVSNATGEYSFAAVDPGVYTVRASVQGFKTFERQGIRIATQTFITLDIVLEVGALEETITVTGDAPLIDRTSWCPSRRSTIRSRTDSRRSRGTPWAC